MNKIIDMARDKNHPLGIIYRLFNDDWLLTRVRKVTLWFIINAFRLFPEPVTQSIATSIALNSINDELQFSINEFSKSLGKLIYGSGVPFSDFEALKLFFEPTEGFLPLKAKKGLLERLKPRKLKYDIIKDGKKITKDVILMPDVKHLYTYLKGELNDFLVDEPSQFNKLINNIERVLEKATNLLSSLITAAVQYDCGAVGFGIQILAEKSRPDIIVMLLQQMFAVIPSSIRRLLLDREIIGDTISHGLRKTVDHMNDFPDSLEGFFKKNVPSIDQSKIKEAIQNLKSMMYGKDIAVGFIDRVLVSNVEKFVNLFYLIVPYR